MPLEPETIIAQYKILGKIGEGGMGEVYLAEDSKLHRKVALKFLPEHLASDTGRMQRFIQEARAASALNHPNIITIFDIGDSDSVRFIATEFIDGKSLDELMEEDDADDISVLDIAIQVASALNAAHHAGIVHRDLKPENIMVRSDGIVKVLDFGLAKLTGEGTGGQSIDKEAATKVQVKTEPGKIMGTAAYMSPEQARGLEVDERTDIWSFGVVLYEMLAGRRPFFGETASDLIAAILTSEPRPVSDFADDVPEKLALVISKALRKSKDERFQHIDDMLVDLREIARELDFSARTGTGTVRLKRGDRGAGETLLNQPTTAHHSGVITETKTDMISARLAKRPLILLTAAVLFGLGIAAAGFYFLGPGSSSNTPFQNMRIAKITSKGNVAAAIIAISPDGKYVVFAAEEDGRQSLWLRQVATPSDVQILEPAETGYAGLSFSVDGDYIYYVAREPQKPGAIYKIPTLGGEPEKILEDVDGSITFSPQGDKLAFVRSETSLMTVSADGSGLKELARAPEGVRWTSLAWRPDGETIASAAFSSKDSADHLYEVTVSNGDISEISSPPWLRISGIAWLTGGSALVLSGRDPDTRMSQIWHLSYPEGIADRITNDLSSYFGLSISASGNNLASIQDDLLSNIWTYEPGSGSPPVQVTFEEGLDEGMSGVAWVPDGRIVYTVRTAGRQDLWIIDRDGKNAKQLTRNSKSNFSPVVSPDGRSIVFISNRNGNTDLWKMTIEGGDPVVIADSEGIEGAPDISPDGKWVVYQVTDGDNVTTIWRVPIDGGNPGRLTNSESGRPRVSADGRFILCEIGEAHAEQAPKIAVLPFDGGEPVKLFEAPQVLASRDFRWAFGGNALVFVDSTGKVDNLYEKSIGQSTPRTLTSFASDRIFRFDLSADGKRIVMARGHESSDVVMIKGLK